MTPAVRDGSDPKAQHIQRIYVNLPCASAVLCNLALDCRRYVLQFRDRAGLQQSQHPRIVLHCPVKETIVQKNSSEAGYQMHVQVSKGRLIGIGH